MNTVDVSKDWTAKYVRNVYTQENYIELMKECTASGKKKKNRSLLARACQIVVSR